MTKLKEKKEVIMDWFFEETPTWDSVTDRRRLSQALSTFALEVLEGLEVEDVDVEEPGLEMPSDPATAADQAFNGANKMWRTMIAQRKEELSK